MSLGAIPLPPALVDNNRIVGYGGGGGLACEGTRGGLWDVGSVLRLDPVSLIRACVHECVNTDQAAARRPVSALYSVQISQPHKV